MSGSLSPLALSMMGATTPNQAPGTASVPLASMPLASNAIGLQQQNASLPWYAVPGMFQQPPAPTPALAASGAGAGGVAAPPAGPVGAQYNYNPMMVPPGPNQAQLQQQIMQESDQANQAAQRMGGGGGT